jgi:hypothetical protein
MTTATCPVCGLEYTGEKCPNQFRIRQGATVELPVEQHEQARRAIESYRAGRAALGLTF